MPGKDSVFSPRGREKARRVKLVLDAAARLHSAGEPLIRDNLGRAIGLEPNAVGRVIRDLRSDGRWPYKQAKNPTSRIKVADKPKATPPAYRSKPSGFSRKNARTIEEFRAVAGHLIHPPASSPPTKFERIVSGYRKLQEAKNATASTAAARPVLHRTDPSSPIRSERKSEKSPDRD